MPIGSKVPIVSANAVKINVPETVKLGTAVQLTLIDQGDGFYPLKGVINVSNSLRNIKDVNGEVIAGSGMHVLVRDYVARIDGVIVGGQNKDNLDPRTTTSLTVSGSGTKYIVLTTSKIAISDGSVVSDHQSGVLSIRDFAPAPNSGAIKVARLDIPLNTTQITSNMIDNSIKDFTVDTSELNRRIKKIETQLNITTPTIPTAPSDLSATSTLVDSVTLLWVDNSNNEDHFELEKSTTSNSGFTLAATLDPDVTFATVSGLTANTTYYFRVRATNDAGASSYSNTVSATTMQSGTGGSTLVTSGLVSWWRFNGNWNDTALADTGVGSNPANNAFDSSGGANFFANQTGCEPATGPNCFEAGYGYIQVGTGATPSSLQNAFWTVEFKVLTTPFLAGFKGGSGSTYFTIAGDLGFSTAYDINPYVNQFVMLNGTEPAGSETNLWIDVPGNAAICAGVFTPDSSTLTYVSVTYDGTTLKVYKNGALFASTTAFSGPSTYPNSLAGYATVFNGRGIPDGLNGMSYGDRMDFLRVYSRALTASEITQNFNSGI